MKWNCLLLCMVVASYMPACSKNNSPSKPDTEVPPPSPLPPDEMGAGWLPLPEGGIADIQFFDNRNGFMGGLQGLYKTSDGGMHWTAVLQNRLIDDFSFIDLQNGWVAYDKKLFRTQDGGVSFQQLTTFSDSLVRVAFKDQLTGWASDRKNALWQTTDGGSSWTRSKQFESLPYTLQLTDADHGKVLLSTDVYEYRNGQYTRTLFVPNNPLSDIHFTDDDHGWAVSPYNQGIVYRYIRP